MWCLISIKLSVIKSLNIPESELEHSTATSSSSSSEESKESSAELTSPMLDNGTSGKKNNNFRVTRNRVYQQEQMGKSNSVNSNYRTVTPKYAAV